MKRKLIIDLFKGGKKAAIGETRNWGGKDYVKTQEGWQYQPGNKEKKAPETAQQPEQAASVESKPSESQETPKEAPVKKPRKPRAKKEAKKEENKEPAETPKEIPSTNTPRSEAAPSEASKEEYTNARESEISNVGKDIKGAARHRKTYSSIKDLRNSDEANIDLKYLLKQFPINLIDDVSTSNAFNPYIANQILNRFPKTIKSEKQREMYLDTFDFVRNRVQELSKEKDLLFTDILKTIQKEVVEKMKANRAAPGYVRGSDDFLVSYVNKTLSIRAIKGSVAQDVVDYVAATKTLIPDVDGLSRQEATAKAYEEMASEEGVERVKRILEGADFKKVFSVESKGTKSKKFNVSDMYLKEAKRKGPETELKTVDEQVDFMVKKCELKAIQWGNSVTDDERKHHLKMSADAFSDLGDILGLPEKMISYNGRLGLAIGARGHGTAMATYEPGEVVINLTRVKGVGSLAHEWGHFVDNILAKTHKVSAHADNTFLSEAARWNLGEASPVKDAMKELVGSEVWGDFTDTTRQALRDLQEMGIKEKAQYWMSPRELFARAFEGYVSYKLEEKGRENTYLSGGSEGLMWCNKEQKEKMAPLFDKLFKELRDSDYIEKALNLDNDLMKGSLQRKMGNPKKQVTEDESRKTLNWTDGIGGNARYKIPEATPEAKQRFFHKLHSLTEVRRHPKTGERMFLMHRGESPDNPRQHLNENTSWTPKYQVAKDFAYDYSHESEASDTDALHSAWIPESAIHTYINNAAATDNEKSANLHEHEFIIKPHKFIYAKKNRPLDSKEKINQRINTREELANTTFGDESTPQDNIRQYNKKIINQSKLATSETTENDLMKGDSDKRYQFKNNKDQESQDNIRLYRGLTQPFNPKFDLAHSDAPHGYSTWTDNEELARQYSGKEGHVYHMDLPKSKMGRSPIDENPKSETYGDRHLFFFNDKPAGLNNVKGKEYLVYNHHDDYDPQKIFKKNEDLYTDLMKAADDDAVAKLPESHQHLKEPLLDWSRKSIPSAPMRTWYLNHVAQNPEIHDTHKEEMKHHGDMFKQNKELGKIPFSKKVSLEAGLNSLREADKVHQSKTPEISGIKPNKDTTNQIDLGNGWGWHDLGTNQDDDEAKAMGHCGTGHPDCNLWSLRKEVKDKKGNVYHQPHVTVEMLEGGIINQIKGKNNEKPNKKYHDAILPLLHSEHVNHIISQGYKPETNFHVGDLEESHHKDLITKKPDIHPFEMTNPEQIKKTINKIPHEYQDSLQDWGGMVEDYHNLSGEKQNPTYQDIINFNIEHGDDATHHSLIEHPSMGREQLGQMFNKTNNSSIKDKLLKNPNISPEILTDVVHRGTPNQIIRAVQNPSIPQDKLIESLNHHDNVYIRAAAVRNPLMPPEHLEAVAQKYDHQELKDQNNEILHEIAQKENLTPKTREILVNHPQSGVRSRFVNNQTQLTPEEAIKLSQDEDDGIRHRLAQNTNMPEEAIKNLINSKDYETKRAIARHPDLQSHHLAELAGNLTSEIYDEDAAMSVFNHKNVDHQALQAMVDGGLASMSHHIALHPKTPAKALNRLAGDTLLTTRGRVARHPNAAPETLHRLAKDKETAVRQNVAQRKDLTPELIKILQNDPDPYVQGALHDFHPELKNKLAASEDLYTDLMKAADDDAVAKLPESHQHLKEPLLNWSRESIPHAPMRTWYLNHVAKNPEIHDTHKEEIKHHGDMARFNQEIGRIPFSKKMSFEEGLGHLQNADKNYQKQQKIGLATPDVNTKKMIDIGNNWGWFNLNTNKSDEEATAMGHCGTGHPDCNIWSLRKEVQGKDGKTYHQPHVTVEMLEGGIINQIKGKQNEKPRKKYHDAILPLLHSEHVNHIISQGYKPETNFHVGDLEESHHKDLIAKKPDIHPFEMTDLNQLDQTIEKMPSVYRQHLNDWKDIVENFSEHAKGQGIANPTHKDIIDNAIKWGNEGDHNFLTRHPSINGEQLHDLYTHQLVTKTGYEVLKNPNTLPKTLHEAITNPKDSSHLLQAAKHPSLPEEDMRELAKLKDNYYLQTQLTRNPAVPQDIVEGMWNEHKNKEVNGDHEDLLREITAKANLTPQMRQEASNHPSKHIRRKFTERRDLTDSEMLQMAQDEDSDNQYRLTLRKELPENVIDKLLTRADTSIHHSLSRHPSAQPRHLKKIAEKGYDENEYRNILNHPNLDEDTLHAMINPNAREFEHKIAGHSNSTAGVLHRLRGSVADSVRGQVARHDNTGFETLRVLAKDRSEHVRQDVAQRKDLTPELIKILQNDPEQSVKDVLHDFHPELKNKLAASELTENDLMKADAIDKTIKHVRRGVSSVQDYLAEHGVNKVLATGFGLAGLTHYAFVYDNNKYSDKQVAQTQQQIETPYARQPSSASKPNKPKHNQFKEDVKREIKDQSNREVFRRYAAAESPLSPTFFKNTLKSSRELAKEYGSLLELSSNTLSEVINKHNKLKEDVADFHHDRLSKQHGGDHHKMIEAYKSINSGKIVNE